MNDTKPQAATNDDSAVKAASESISGATGTNAAASTNKNGKKTRIAVVTGASSGLGLEFARQIDAKRDVDEIWLIARNEKKLEEVASTLHTPAVPVPADLSNSADIATIAQKISDDDLAIVYLVNAAGFGRFGAWDDISEQDAEGMIDLDCRGLVSMTRACLPSMERDSHIIQIASAAAFVPLPYMNVYAACKAFVLRYTRALRWELHGSGITVTALCPTWVKTGFEKQARKSKNGHAVRHLLFAQEPSTVVRRALEDNEMHFAVSCASLPSLGLRLVGKIVPYAITMAAWDLIRKI